MININFKKFNIIHENEPCEINGNIEFSNDDLTLIHTDSNAYFYNVLMASVDDIVFTGELSVNQDNIDIKSLKNVQNIRMNKLDIISEDAMLVPNLNVIENITFALGPQSKKDPLLSLKQFDLEMLGNAFPGKLSKVQRLTVSLIQSLIRSVELIVIDSLLDDFNDIEMREINDVLRKCCDYFNKRIIVLTKEETINLKSSNVYRLNDGYLESISKTKSNFTQEVKS